jgi:superfamily II DNA or RNA helicase
MAAEGLDIPELNTLFMVTSRKEVEQAVGRVVRKIDPNIRPMIWDFTDQLPSFINQGRHRRRLYKKMGFEVKVIEVMNNEIIREIEGDQVEKINEIVKPNNEDCEFLD